METDQRIPLIYDVGFRKDFKVFHKGYGIAGNIDNVVIPLNHFQGSVIQSCPRGIHQNRMTVVNVEINTAFFESSEASDFVHGLGKLFSAHAKDFKVCNVVSGNAELRGLNRGF